MGLMKKLTSALVASSLVLSIASSAFAAYTPSAGQTAGVRMMELKILKGLPGDDKLGVNQEITRAQLVTIIVRAFGKEADAQLLKGAPAFPDTASHWASGEIAMAKALVEKVGGDAIGMPDGSFAPDGKLTPAQAVAFLMKFMGIKRDTTKSWPNDYLDAAVAAELITAEDKATIAPMLNANATRGLVFYLFDNAFYSYELPNGKTFYTTYADTEKPALTATVSETNTLDSKVTVTGTVGADAVVVNVGSAKVTPDANGAFTAEVQVAMGENPILVTAADVAGNVAEVPLKVTRTIGTAATIEAAAITVAAGATVNVAAVVKDAKGNVLTGAVVTGETTVGTFADGKFTAATKAGTGTLTLKSGEAKALEVAVTITAAEIASVVADDASVAPGTIVTLTAKDAYGNVVTGATFTQSSADAMLDAATGKFTAQEPGTYVVKATANGKTVESTIGVYGEVAKLGIEAPKTIVANGETEITVLVKALDEFGNLVPISDTTDDNHEATLDSLFSDAALVEEFKDGVATFTLTAARTLVEREIDLTATYSDADEATATVETIAPVATGIKVAAPEYLLTNEGAAPANVTITVVDQEGVAMEEGGYQFTVTVSGPATFEDGKTTKDITSSSINVIPNDSGVSGDVTVTASFTGLTTGRDTMKAAYAQAAKVVKLTSDVSTQVVNFHNNTADADTYVYDTDKKWVEYTVVVTDSKGVPVASVPGDAALKATLTVAKKANVVFSTLDEEGWTDPEALDTADTALVFDGNTAKFRVASAEAQTIKVVIEDANEEDVLPNSAELATAFTTGAAKYVGFATDTLVALEGNAGTAISAQVYDVYGNKVAKSGIEVIFNANSYDGVKIEGAAKAYTALTNAEGKATVTVTAANYVNGFTITLGDSDDLATTDDTLKVLGTALYEETEVTLVEFVPTTVSMEIVTDENGEYDVVAALADQARTSSVVAGNDVYLKVTLKDNFGRTVKGLYTDAHANDGAFELVVTDNSDNFAASGDWTEVADASGNATGTYVYGPIDPTKAEALNLTVSVKNLAVEAKASRALTVKPAAAAMVIVAEAEELAGMNAITGTLEFTAKETKEYTLRVTDIYGNFVAASAVTSAITVTVTGDDAELRTSTGAALDNDTATDGIQVVIAKGTNSKKVLIFSTTADANITFTVGTNSFELNPVVAD